ncbi:MAG: hypothetical protein ACE5IQ_02275 [Candidatus Methylomirabilales bacterium]
MAKGERKLAKLASRETNGQAARVYTCPADGSKMMWVQYLAGNGRGRTALRCDKCGAIKFRSDL